VWSLQTSGILQGRPEERPVWLCPRTPIKSSTHEHAVRLERAANPPTRTVRMSKKSIRAEKPLFPVDRDSNNDNGK